jgi:hypothetical protein
MTSDGMQLFEVRHEERRRDERAALTLSGRYMLRDDNECRCRTIDISAGGVALRGFDKGHIGERVIAYINEIGRIEGTVARHFDTCFAVKLQAPLHKREKLAAKIAWLIGRQTKGAPDNRQHRRTVPAHWRTKLRTPEGNVYHAALIDLSLPGAALNVDVAPSIGSPVTIGRTPAHVVRHFSGGIAVAFASRLSSEFLREGAVL